MALSTFESRKSNAKFDKLVHTGHHENPTSKMFTEIAAKLDELVVKINSIDAAITVGSSTTIAFGDMITVPAKGKTPASYSIVMTVTNGGVSKSTTLTLT